MERFTIPNPNGYDIPCCASLQGDGACVILCHGFASSQESPTILALRSLFSDLGLNWLSFDFPFHGCSTAKAESLRLPTCVSDLLCIESFLQQRSPHSTLLYFGSSFGAYILLLHFAQHPQSGRQAFLRSAAVRMPQIVQTWLHDPTLHWTAPHPSDPLSAYCALDSFYGRSFGMTAAFVHDLAEHDLFALYPLSPAPQLFMIHGEQDSTALCSDATDFAALANATLQVLPGAEHRLMGDGEQALVLTAVRRWLASL